MQLAKLKLEKCQKSKMNFSDHSYEILDDYQQQGIWPIADNSLLSGKYNNRFAVAKRLFDKLDNSYFTRHNTQQDISSWEDPNIPNKSFSKIHSGNVFSYDSDYMASPEHWELENPTEFVQRQKLYVYDWSTKLDDEDFDYFVDMHNDFKPVLDHYLNECYSDQRDLWKENLYKLMIIQYNTSNATKENIVEHRKWNTERFGDEHFDETLGGLHLGENYSEFRALNTKTNKWEIIKELTKNKQMWMFGEHSQLSGWIPTTHGMIHNPQQDLEERYSIIFDLQARYK